MEGDGRHAVVHPSGWGKSRPDRVVARVPSDGSGRDAMQPENRLLEQRQAEERD
jgi:hypothetical protein